MLWSRVAAALAYAGAAFLFGVALGERGELGAVQHVFRVVIAISTIVLFFISRRGRVQVILTGAAILTGVVLGQQHFERAWLDCAARAEGVRLALIEHQSRSGEYPARLEELEMKLPCSCAFRTTILHYLSNDRGFKLWYTNDRETFTATERSSIRSRH